MVNLNLIILEFVLGVVPSVVILLWLIMVIRVNDGNGYG